MYNSECCDHELNILFRPGMSLCIDHVIQNFYHRHVIPFIEDTSLPKLRIRRVPLDIVESLENNGKSTLA